MKKFFTTIIAIFLFGLSFPMVGFAADPALKLEVKNSTKAFSFDFVLTKSDWPEDTKKDVKIQVSKNQEFSGVIFKEINVGDRKKTNETITSSVSDLEEGKYFVRALHSEDMGGGISVKVVRTVSQTYPVEIKSGGEGNTGDATGTEGSQVNGEDPSGSQTAACESLLNFKIEVCFSEFLDFVLYQPTAWLARISGKILDFFVFYSLQSSSYNQSSFINEGWKVTRDISNLAFIFILLWAAISTITGMGNSDAKRAIGMVILIAILINFSLFFSKVIIDTGNVMARVLYNSIEAKIVDEKGEIVKSVNGEKQISASLVAQFNPQKLRAFKEGQFDLTRALATTLIAVAVNILMMWVFLSISFLFVARVIGLWVAMIFSPIAFISVALPVNLRKKLGDYGWDGWLGSITSLAFMAPVFVFFMYLILMFASIKDLFSFGSTKDPVTSIIAVIIPLAIIITLLFKAKSITVKMSGEIGQMVNKYAGVATGIAAGVATGGLAMAGRATIGRAADALSKNKGVQDWAARSGGLGKLALKSIDTTAKSSMDLRKTQAGAQIAKQSGIDFDNKTANKVVSYATLGAVKPSIEEGKGGYRGVKGRAEKETLEFAKLLETKMSDKEVEAYYTKKKEKYDKDYDKNYEKFDKERTKYNKKYESDYEVAKNKGKIETTALGKPFDEARFRKEYDNKNRAQYEKDNGKPPAMPEAPVVHKTQAEANKAIRKEYGEKLKEKQVFGKGTVSGAISGFAVGGITGAALGAAQGKIEDLFSVSRKGELAAAEKLINNKVFGDESKLEKATTELKKIGDKLEGLKEEIILKKQGVKEEDMTVEKRRTVSKEDKDKIKDDSVELKDKIMRKRSQLASEISLNNVEIEKLAKNIDTNPDDQESRNKHAKLNFEVMKKKEEEKELENIFDQKEKKEKLVSDLNEKKKASGGEAKPAEGDKK